MSSPGFHKFYTLLNVRQDRTPDPSHFSSSIYTFQGKLEKIFKGLSIITTHYSFSRTICKYQKGCFATELICCELTEPNSSFINIPWPTLIQYLGTGPPQSASGHDICNWWFFFLPVSTFIQVDKQNSSPFFVWSCEECAIWTEIDLTLIPEPRKWM